MRWGGARCQIRWAPSHRPRPSADIARADWHGNAQADILAGLGLRAAAPLAAQISLTGEQRRLAVGAARVAACVFEAYLSWARAPGGGGHRFRRQGARLPVDPVAEAGDWQSVPGAPARSE